MDPAIIEGDVTYLQPVVCCNRTQTDIPDCFALHILILATNGDFRREAPEQWSRAISDDEVMELMCFAEQTCI